MCIRDRFAGPDGVVPGSTYADLAARGRLRCRMYWANEEETAVDCTRDDVTYTFGGTRGKDDGEDQEGAALYAWLKSYEDELFVDRISIGKAALPEPCDDNGF